MESSQQIRAAMKDGDERYFLARDQGPVRSFIRDYVDSRFSFVELMIPPADRDDGARLLRQPRLASIGNTVLLVACSC